MLLICSVKPLKIFYPVLKFFFDGYGAEFDEDSDSEFPNLALVWWLELNFLSYDNNKVTIGPKVKNDYLNY